MKELTLDELLEIYAILKEITETLEAKREEIWLWKKNYKKNLKIFKTI